MEKFSISVSINSIDNILANTNIREKSLILRAIKDHYSDAIGNTMEYYKHQIDYFYEQEFKDSLTLHNIPIVVGLNLRQYLTYLLQITPGIVYDYDSESQLFKITYLL